MKRIFIAFLLMICVTQVMCDVNKFKEIKDFPIGGWQYMDTKTQSPLNVKDWADLGLNVVISPRYFADTTPKEKFIEILDECEKKNIKVIVQDMRCFYSELSKGEDVYRKQVKAAISDFGSHPAVLGFYICDEPNKSNLDQALKASKINKELAPNLSPFINQNPWGKDEWMPNFLGFKTCEEFIDYICKNGAIDIISMDCYYQLKKDNPDGWDIYFRSLNRYSKEARKHNLPFWATNLSCPHYDMINLNDDTFRWQISTSFAHGANGLMWYVIRPTVKGSNYRNGPINLFGEKTKTFEDLSFENRFFTYCYNTVAPKLVLENAYHVYKSYGDTPLFEGNDIIKSISSKKEIPIVISFFKDGYVCVVNNSITENSYITMTIGDNVKKTVLFADNGDEREVSPTTWSGLTVKDKNIEFWLAPGGMELFRINKN